MSIGFGGGGWGWGVGFGGSSWSVGVSSGWGGWGGWGWGGWGGWGWPGWSPGWGGWCSPWVANSIIVTSPVFVATPVVATTVLMPPIIVEQPVVYAPSSEWIASFSSVPASEVAVPDANTGGMVLASTSPFPAPPMPAPGALEQSAWNALSSGDYAAESMFAAVLNEEPGNPRARAGYGIASAMIGHTATAAWALRDALALEPEILNGLPIGESLAWRLTVEARQIESQVMEAPAGGRDALFLAAALRAVVGDRAQAAHALALSAQRGPLDEVESRFRSTLAAQLAVHP